MFTFERSDVNTILLTVLRLTGSAPDFPTDYTTPQVRIAHINGIGEVEDLAYTNMTQIGSTNQWYYKYTIEASAPFTKYLVTFRTDIDSIETFSTEEYKVIPEAGALSGDGDFAVDLTFKQSINNQPIVGAVVKVFDKSNPTVVIAQSETDSDGNVFLFLDAGTYLLSVKKTGLISEIHTLVVYGNGTHNVIGS